ncbi:MAG: M81 family metallopeptidase, partial [bacterium]|nr:M81 family metallopeptidase [bacterium]
MSGPRVAVGGILTECNDFGGQPIDVAAFERFELRYGDDVLEVAGGVMGGMLEVLAEREATPVPLLFASTSPGGPLTDECYGTLRRDLLTALKRVIPVDAVLLALHGAAVSETVHDIEGDLLAAARALVGPGVPIVATLDLHAHVTEAMVTNADGLVAWETYPHRDSYTTGRRGAALVVDAAVGAATPTMVMAKVPVLTGAVYGSTEGEGPFADMMRKAKRLEARPDVLSTSMFLVHPFIDRPGMGS